MHKLELSIVIPLFNEEESIPTLLKEVSLACNKTGKTYEIVLVDDGSNDGTYDLLQKSAAKDNHLKIVKLSRNFGHQAAFTAGIDIALGLMVITMDGDLQHPPALIPAFTKEADNGYDIVIGERIVNKQNSKGRELFGKLFYKFLSWTTRLEFKNVSDFALYNRKVVSVIKHLPEKERYLRGIIQWVGFSKKYLLYVVDERKFGVPKYNFKRLTHLVMSGVTSFSAFPLRLAFWVGLVVLISSFFFGIYVAIDHYVNPNPLIAGWATLVILVLFLGSIQLMVLGIIGEYLYRMFNEIKGRPSYIISEIININKDELEKTPYGIL